MTELPSKTKRLPAFRTEPPRSEPASCSHFQVLLPCSFFIFLKNFTRVFLFFFPRDELVLTPTHWTWVGAERQQMVLLHCRRWGIRDCTPGGAVRSCWTHAGASADEGEGTREQLPNSSHSWSWRENVRRMMLKAWWKSQVRAEVPKKPGHWVKSTVTDQRVHREPGRSVHQTCSWSLSTAVQYYLFIYFFQMREILLKSCFSSAMKWSQTCE